MAQQIAVSSKKSNSEERSDRGVVSCVVVVVAVVLEVVFGISQEEGSSVGAKRSGCGVIVVVLLILLVFQPRCDHDCCSNFSLIFKPTKSKTKPKKSALRTMILDNYQKNKTSSGILVRMDGVEPLFPPMSPMGPGLNVTGYMLAALTGFFAFLVFFGCVLICAQAGFITARSDEHGRIVLFAGRASASSMTTTALRLMSNGLLTEAQVLALPLEEFHKPSQETKTHATTITTTTEQLSYGEEGEKKKTWS